jgi:hypothetical protein
MSRRVGAKTGRRDVYAKDNESAALLRHLPFRLDHTTRTDRTAAYRDPPGQESLNAVRSYLLR